MMADTNDISGTSEALVDRECTCGHFYGVDISSKDEGQGQRSSMSRSPSSTTAGSTPLDASFVHLPPSLLVREEELAPSRKQREESKPSTGFLDSYKHLRVLEQAANSPTNPPRLCLKCVQRVENALIADTERLERECLTYREAVLDEEARVDNWKRALEVAATAFATTDNSNNNEEEETYEDGMLRREEALENEIEMLRQACQQQEEELARLISLQRDQALVLKELDQLECATEEAQNDLELEAKAFDNDQEQLFKILAEVQDEVQRLSSPQIQLPSVLYNLQVDKERGLRYPLINDLRLAYRPKGDVQWDEIQVAWSLAAQLLLVTATLFEFQSENWRIIPLSHCAKLIYCASEVSHDETGKKKQRAVVYNLGHPRTKGCKALLAWNSLLHKVIQHTTVRVHKAIDCGILDPNLPSLPFEISPAKIGNVALANLDENDDAGWSRAIHLMACDLLWLSECASAYILQKVLLTTSISAD